MREYQVRICERLRVKFPGPTRQTRKSAAPIARSALPSRTEVIRQARQVRKVPNPEVAPFYLITSSAWASSEGGTVRSSVLR